MFDYRKGKGPSEASIVRQALKAGRPIPASILNAPRMTNDLLFYAQAFIELATCRNYEGGQIPWTAVNDYAFRYDIEGDEFDAFADIILKLDAHIVAGARKKPPEKAEK